MRDIIIGAGVAATLGLALGAIARPNLLLQPGSIPMEPVATYALQGGAALPAYPGRTPDYVVGTDWATRNDDAVAAQALAEVAAAQSAGRDASAQVDEGRDDAWRVEEAGPDPGEAQPPPPSYPSVDGDILPGAAVANPSGAYHIAPSV